MSEPLPPPSLARAREQKINELSQHFANDDLSLEDLERRIERVYKASSMMDLEQITADLHLPATLSDPRHGNAGFAPIRETPLENLPANFEVPRSRLLAFMSSTRRVGRWAVPRDLDMFAMMSDNRLDFTNAALPVGGVVNVDLTAIMTAVKIIVPPGMRVINEMHSFMAEVKSGADELATDGLTSPTMPVLRLRGTAIMAEVKVKVRRREESAYYRGEDDDDDDN